MYIRTPKTYMNILYWNTYYENSASTVLQRLQRLDLIHGLDVFCLSEAHPSLVVRLEQDGYNVHYTEKTDRSGVLIASRQDFEIKERLLSQSRKRGKSHASHLLIAEFTGTKKPLRIGVTHMANFYLPHIPRRHKEVRKVASYLPDDSAIIGGDLNTVGIHFAARRIQKLGYQSLARGKTWKYHLRGKLALPLKLQLDHAFASHDIADRVRAFILGDQDVSDHFPILVTAEV